MAFGRKSKPLLARGAAMKARPAKAPVVRRKDLQGGRVEVTVRLRRPTWLRMLGSSDEFDRTYGLDELGLEVYDTCDGRTTVQQMVQRFASAHRVSVPEAELSVTTFLKTLLVKGLVVIQIDRGTQAEEGR
jgi:hypothetical protein